ncbi:hypothetical protein OG976_13630 [Mycobacterium sp. NBC_00419]|uniref:hypothetical protein n=1 Tax=Mycobacterium sp. NBC_00419 TaxID=2975989 RepID=UPI002E1B41D9
MKLAVVLALAGLLALVIALLTDSTWLALAVIALAVVGIVFLVRDWRADHRHHAGGTADPAPADVDEPTDRVPARLSPDMFSPDISADDGGPSADARAD